MSEQNSLLTLVTPRTVLIKEKVSDWREAIRIAGKLLVNEGFVVEDYVDQCLQAAVTMGPYYVLCPGVAISHARPGQAVKQLCLATVTLDPPVPFGHQYNDPVSILFMFGSLNKEAHLVLLKNLGRLLTNNDNLKRLAAADSFTDLYDLLESALK